MIIPLSARRDSSRTRSTCRAHWLRTSLGTTATASSSTRCANYGHGIVVDDRENDAIHVQRTLEQFSAATIRLARDIPPHIFAMIKDLLARFQEFWNDPKQGLAKRQQERTGYGGGGGRLSAMQRDDRDRLVTLVEEALPPDHPLHNLVQFGLALGSHVDLAELLAANEKPKRKDESLPDERVMPDTDGLLQRLALEGHAALTEMLAATARAKRKDLSLPDERVMPDLTGLVQRASASARLASSPPPRGA